jgi:uncharacterized protein YuzE
MRVDYDSEGDTIQIDLEPAGRVDYGDDEIHDRIVVSIRDGRPVRIDVIGTGDDLGEPLRTAAERYGLDAEALLAAAQAALAAPDREVVVDVSVRAAA